MRMFRKKRINTEKSSWKGPVKKRRTEKMKKWVNGKKLIITLVIIIFSATYYIVATQDLFKIQQVIITSEQQNMNTEGVKAAIALPLIGRNMVWISQSEIRKQIYALFHDVSSVSVTRKWFGTLEIEISGFERVGIVKMEGERYYLDRNGVLLAFDDSELSLPTFELFLRQMTPPKPPESGTKIAETPPPELPTEPDSTNEESTANLSVPDEENLTLKIIEGKQQSTETTSAPTTAALPVEKQPKTESPLGKQVISPEQLQRILTTVQELQRQSGLTAVHLQYFELGGELHVKMNQEFWILISLLQNLEQQLKKLKRSLDVLDPLRLSRIDVSIEGNKVFYSER